VRNVALDKDGDYASACRSRSRAINRRDTRDFVQRRVFVIENYDRALFSSVSYIGVLEIPPA